jgi:hypothetical protein
MALVALRGAGAADAPLHARARQHHNAVIAEAQQTVRLLALVVHHRKAIAAVQTDRCDARGRS